ncbi:MAG: lamin tail domain-containing protein [Bacteroidota bacterium]
MKISEWLLGIALGFLLLNSCETDDVEAPIMEEELPEIFVSLTPTSIPENGGIAILKVDLSESSDNAIVVNFSFQGSAIIGDDYVLSSEQITLSPGAISGEIEITAQDNDSQNEIKTVEMTVASVEGATAANDILEILTIDDDEQILLSLSPNTIGENGQTAELTVGLSEPSSEPVIVDFAFMGTAVIDVDYTLSAQQITLNPGETSGSLEITSIDNAVENETKAVVIKIDNIQGSLAPEGISRTLSILDDDQVAFIINEVLYDPPGGLEGDANGDGTRDPNQDEFIEMVNISAAPLDISGWKFYDAESLEIDQPSHLVPPGTIIQPGKAFVVFGGGSPTGSFGGAIVQVASGGQLNMNNSGDFVTVTDADDNIIQEFDVEPLSNNPDESYTRNPDLTGEFEQHNDNTPLLYSPGMRIDGTSF